MVLLSSFYEGATFTYFVLPFLIFVARICDVSIGTIRIVMVAKGQKIIAPILGFFEVLIWLLAISRIFENLDNWVCYFAYGAGFATGNYVGMYIEEKLAMGIIKIQIITSKPADILIEKLLAAGYGITHHDARGGTENVSIIYSIIKRTELPKMAEQIKTYNPNAFYSIEDVKFVSRGIFAEKTVAKRWRIGK
ncbi:MAG: DUF2179 domain-containing protein [Draconibacterium sp.]|nr:DUF2179 domain-containing protein [Draconibacterium sp.]